MSTATNTSSMFAASFPSFLSLLSHVFVQHEPATRHGWGSLALHICWLCQKEINVDDPIHLDDDQLAAFNGQEPEPEAAMKAKAAHATFCCNFCMVLGFHRLMKTQCFMCPPSPYYPTVFEVATLLSVDGEFGRTWVCHAHRAECVRKHPTWRVDVEMAGLCLEDACRRAPRQVGVPIPATDFDAFYLCAHSEQVRKLRLREKLV